MKLPVLLQLGQLGLSLCLGAALGLLYALLALVREHFPRLTSFCDGIFGHILLSSLLLFALTVGRGEFRIFFYPGISLGAAISLAASRRFSERRKKKFEKIEKNSFLLRKNKV